MSGIAGIFQLNGGKIKNIDLELMKEKLIHRGIDGDDFFYLEKVALLSLSLHVSPESISEKQPYTKDNCTITADARIDNRQELIEKLEINPSYSSTISDSEIILAAYNYWGEDCLFHLIGDFAFAIWDQNKEQLFCGRDHMGVRPFYYYYKKGEIFAFASEIKALIALDFVPKTLNKQKIAIYLCWLSDKRAFKESTFYQNIVSLQPAFSLKVSERKIERKFCWDLNLERFSHLITEEDFVKTFKEYFIEAVRCRIRTNFGVSAHLSGGLDSSSIVCVANILLSKQITTLHDVTEQLSTDEREYAEAVLKDKNLNHFWVKPEGEYFETLDIISGIFDRPEHYNAPCQKLLTQSKIINNQSCRLLLTGLDGDTVVGHGTDILFDYLKQEEFSEFEIEIKNYAEKIETVSYIKEWSEFDIEKKIYTLSEWRIKKIILEYLKKGNLVKSLIISIWAKKTFRISFLEILSFLVKSLYSKVKNILKYKNKNYPFYISKNLFQPLSAQTVIKKQFNWNLKINNEKFFEIYSAGFIELIEEYNHIGGFYNYEVVHPFFDKRLIELCLVIPKKFNFKHGLRRGILRNAMLGILPEKVRLRDSKIDFTDYVFDSLESIKFDIKDFLKSNQKTFENYINIQVFLKYISDIFNNKERSGYYKYLNQSGRVIYFIKWLKFISNEKKKNVF